MLDRIPAGVGGERERPRSLAVQARVLQHVERVVDDLVEPGDGPELVRRFDVVAAALGLEAYGLGGLIVATLVAMFFAAVIRTLTAGDGPSAMPAPEPSAPEDRATAPSAEVAPAPV